MCIDVMACTAEQLSLQMGRVGLALDAALAREGASKLEQNSAEDIIHVLGCVQFQHPCGGSSKPC